MPQTIYMMTGIPGSGKSYTADCLSEITGAVVVSSDSIREMLYGDAATQGNSKVVFDKFYEMAREYLDEGADIILDATNINRKNRKRVFDEFRVDAFDPDEKIIVAVPVEPGLEVSLRRNNDRCRKVPNGVIVRMWKQYEPPTCGEGFDYIMRIGE